MAINPTLFRTPEEIRRQEIEYPSSDGERMAENDLQYIALTDTVDALRTRLGNRSDVYVAGDMLIYYREGDVSSRVAPDVYVVFGANGNHPRMSWLVWEEGLPPTFVLEVGSPSTWRRDAGEKRDIYARIGVAEYWRFDAMGDLFSPGLIGEELVDGTYHPLDVYTDESGALRGHSPTLGLDLCVRDDNELRLFDPADGTWLLRSRDKSRVISEQREALREQTAEIERLRAQMETQRRER